MTDIAATLSGNGTQHVDPAVGGQEAPDAPAPDAPAPDAPAPDAPAGTGAATAGAESGKEAAARKAAADRSAALARVDHLAARIKSARHGDLIFQEQLARSANFLPGLRLPGNE